MLPNPGLPADSIEDGFDLPQDWLASFADDGFAVLPGALPPSLRRGLLAEAAALQEEDALEQAQIGRGQDQTLLRSVRRTKIAWLDGTTPVQREFLRACEALRLSVNRALFLGLFEFEAHFAHYPPGGFYARHLDAFRLERGAGPGAALGRKASRSRVLSLVAYLGEEWQEEDGGELALWRDLPMRDARPDLDALRAEDALRVPPRGGDVVLMLSERIPHEVLPTTKDRYAIAGWFRVNASVAGSVDPLR
jgi:SM-20-related protein